MAAETESTVPSSSGLTNGIKDTITCGICLEVFSNPRRLRCSHIFCLKCLTGYQTTSQWKECPTCRKDCIPPKNELERLPIDQQAVGLANLLKQFDPSAVESSAECDPSENEKEEPKPPSSSTDNGRLMSVLRSDDSDDSSGPSLGGLHELLRMQDSDHFRQFLAQRALASRSSDDELQMALAASMAGVGDGGSNPLADSSSDDDDDDIPGVTGGSGGEVHPGVMCTRCSKPVRGERFRCGICEDFDMCVSCSRETRGLVHDEEHIFVKLKKPADNPPPSRAILHDDSMVMGMSFDQQSREHKIEHGRGCITYKCDSCGVSPIVGTRYKCGNCLAYDLCEQCERKSAEVHNPNHVFLVIPHPTGLHTNKRQLLHNFYSS